MTRHKLLWPVDTKRLLMLLFQKQLHCHSSCLLDTCRPTPGLKKKDPGNDGWFFSWRQSLLFLTPYYEWCEAPCTFTKSAPGDSMLLRGFSHWQSSSGFLPGNHSKLDTFLLRKLHWGRFTTSRGHDLRLWSSFWSSYKSSYLLVDISHAKT